MMRTLLTLLVIAGASVLSAPVSGQVEIGFDAGITNDFGYSIDGNDLDRRLTAVSVPAQNLRLGFLVGDRGTIETLVMFQRLSDGDDDLTAIGLVPGFNYSFGQSGGYARVEGGFMRVGGETQVNLGAALGVKRSIGGGPVSWRLEAGFARWLENEDEFKPAFSRLRLVAGLSARLN